MTACIPGVVGRGKQLENEEVAGMKARPIALSRRILVQVCMLVLVCLPEVVCGQVGRKLVDIPVFVGVDRAASRRSQSDARPSPFDQFWPVIRLREVEGERYEGRAELKIESNTEEPLGCWITATGALAGKYSCKISAVRSLRSGDIVTVGAKLYEPKPNPTDEKWEGTEVATVFVDGSSWQAEVPVIIDSQPAEASSIVTMKQTNLDQYGGCAEIWVGPGAALPLSCKITAMGVFSGEYSCSITTPEELVPGQTVTVCAVLKRPGYHGPHPSDESMTVATLSVEGGVWKTEIPVVVDARDWSSIVTGGGSLVFVPNRDALRLRLLQKSISDFEGCLEFRVSTRAGMKLAATLNATGGAPGKYSCSLVDTDLEAPGGTATICTRLKEANLDAWRRRSDDGRTNHRPTSWPVRRGRVATVSVYGMPAQSDVSVAFSPGVLNLADEEESVTCHLELPEGYTPEDVDVTRLMLNETILAQRHSRRIGDYDEDGRPDLTVEFARPALVERLVSQSSEASEEMELVVTGELVDGTPFRGTDMVRIVRPADGT